MSDQPRPDQPEPERSSPDQPGPDQAAGEPRTERLEAPPAPQAEQEQPQPAPQASGRMRRLVRHRATQLVAAGVAGVVIGGGAMALADGLAGDDHPRRGYRMAPYHYEWGPQRPHQPDRGPRWEGPGPNR